MSKEIFLKSLQTIAFANMNNQIDDIHLVKASDSYKSRINFKSDSKYLLIKSKTFNNFINGNDNPQSLMKALVVGETKIQNGVLYVVKQINGKGGVYLDWRKSNKQPKKIVDDEQGNDLFDVDDFPKLGDITVIKSLGGSTGAQLVEDKQGNKFVMKKGASKEHVEEEYLVNSIYKLMGVNVPTMKLYKTQSGSLILSKFMENTTPLNNVMDDQYLEEVTEHYVLDCLLANWDIYKNDNILVDDDSGDIVRVDNGGGLRYSAQGRLKGQNFGNQVDEIETMLINNPHLASEVTTTKINKQIKEISKNQKKILDLIEDDDLKLTMKMRIADLKMILKNANIVNDDPYRELDEKELEKAMNKANNDLFSSNDLEGWTFLSEICKMRGFNGKPTVVDEKEFKKQLKDKNTIHIQRGLSPYGNRTAKSLMNDFTDSEHCFYGKAGIYGAGIYGAVNADKDLSKPNHVAVDYANYKNEHILDIILPADMKIADGKELDEMMNEEFFGDEFKEAKKDYDKAVDELNSNKKRKEDIEKEIEQEVKDELGWNEKSYEILRKSKPEEVYADTDKFSFDKVANYFKPILKSINGKVEKVDSQNYKITLPNSQDEFLLNSSIASLSLKQKNQNLTPYNYHYVRLKEFLMKEHFSKIKKVVNEKIKYESRNNQKILDAISDIEKSENVLKVMSDNIQNLKTSGSNALNNVMAQIAKRPGGEFRGYYAAIKGYDAIIQKNGWGGDTDFCIILNRSKVIVKEHNNDKK